ncbi:MAG: type II secretion system F family protein [Desulfurococcales archaeon]|nr:type II secretion system F family protein [Desulfurococcales archaeon]
MEDRLTLRAVVSASLSATLAAALLLLLKPPLSVMAAASSTLVILWFGVGRILVRRSMAIIDHDLLYMLLHMRSVATGKPPVSALFESVSKNLKNYPAYSRYMRKIYGLGKEWGYSFSQATRIVGSKADNLVLKNLLSRMSGVLAVGEDVETFLEREYRTLMSEYVNAYHRMTNTARVFMGIYVTILGSLIFVLVTFMLMAFFFGGNLAIIASSYMGVGVALVGMLTLLYMLVGREPFEFYGSPRLFKYKALSITGIAGLALASLISSLYLLKYNDSFEEAARGLLISGIILLPLGIMAKRVEASINNVDDFFPIFIRSFGTHLATLPDMVKALEPLLISQLGKLATYLRRLYSRLANSLKPEAAWRLFAAETGSELVRRAVTIFIDSLKNGGDPEKVGIMLSDHHNEMVRLRKQRLQVAKTFESTLYLMHAAVVIILVFISKLMLAFSSILQNIMEQAPEEVISVFPFQAIDSPYLVTMSIILIAVASVLNSLAIVRVMPGTRTSFFFYFSVLLLISGVSIMVSSELIDYVLGVALETSETIAIYPS